MKSIDVVIGIDPGLTGAVCIWDLNKSGRTAIEIYDTPIYASKKNKKEYMPELMANTLQAYENKKVHVFIEKVHSMPGQGVASMFNFGKGYGIWLGVIAAFKLPHTLVTPQAWKKELMQGMGDKDAARIRACEFFPSQADLLSHKKDIGRADALLIMEFGRRSFR